MGATVFFAQRRATQGGGLLEKLEQIFDAAGFPRLIAEDRLVAIKVQIGERGNTTHLRPELVRRVVKKVRQNRGRPFVTDSGHGGSRADAVGHMILAAEHGFELATVGAPFVVADGLDGSEIVLLPSGAKHFQEVPISAALARSDTVFALSHFTASADLGFSGALANLGLLALGRAARERLVVADSTLIHAGTPGARGEAVSAQHLQERMVEACLALTRQKEGRIGYLNVLLDITPDSDDHPWSDAPFVGDVGILASSDPVALDQASIDQVNDQQGIAGTRLANAGSSDKLTDLHPGVDWPTALAYAERLGLGTRDYELLII